MKKLFMLLAVAGIMVACNSAEDKAKEAYADAMEVAGDAYGQAMDAASEYL